MVKLKYDALIEDICSERCSEEEIEELLKRFESAIQEIAPTSARKAWFDTETTLKPSEKIGSTFTLCLEREVNIDGEKWIGSFEYGGKRLKVIASHQYSSRQLPLPPNHRD